jgi:hypothetical protein
MHIAGRACLHDGRSYFGGRRYADALERELHFCDTTQRLRLIEADLGADEGMLAMAQNEPPVAGDRLVPGIACNLHIADGQPLRRCRLRRALRQG